MRYAGFLGFWIGSAVILFVLSANSQTPPDPRVSIIATRLLEEMNKGIDCEVGTADLKVKLAAAEVEIKRLKEAK